MGLAGPSKKRKISHDPNNTTWTRSEGFGHRILTAQGWSQGTVLGPDPNNPHHTAASHVGIKVMLKDDLLGLGCKGTQEDTCTGLGDLQSLLGRLNGRSDESVKKGEDTRKQMWIQGRYGMRFVRGEVLESTWVTDGLKKATNGDEEKDEDSSAGAEDDDASEGEEQTTDSASGEADETSESQKKQKKRKRKLTAEEPDGSVSSGGESKSEKKKRKAEKALRKAEKAAKKERKEAKRLRKDEKRRAKAEKKALASAIAISITPSSTARTSPIPTHQEPASTSKEPKKSRSLPNSLPTSGTSTPATGRQALRSKWIAHKKMAMMDAKALNEILMIKA
ncbi:hypothetical protein Dda_9442 [Drechslerella dactyloides]|uniref:G-patch domain-containing protein n=1 Tax=Drechslerella dactyloides TaxID=74499 RepID=A0AAD6NF72_DREDA|nr:hypothetical protein Dda_9442 [Drechslerella dactyloides]